MVRKTFAAAIALCAFAVAPAFVLAQDTTTQTQIITTMPQPEQGYGMTIYNAIPVSDQPGFVTWLNGFQPDQRLMVVRTLHLYSVAPNLTPFTTDTTADAAMPVFVQVLPASDQPTFTTFWNGLTPDQQTSFITYARDIYPTTGAATVTTTVQAPTFSTMVQPEQGYAVTIYNALPVADQPNFMTWLNQFTPDQQVMIIDAMHGYAMGGTNVTPFTTTTTPDVALPVLVSVMPTASQDNFRTMWTAMTPEQQNNFVLFARDMQPMTTTTTESTETTTPPAQTTATTETTEMTGAAAQPFGVTMAAAFVGFLPEAERASYNTLAGDTPISELGGMNVVLSKLTPDQAGMVVHALASINAMGMSGKVPQKGMSDQNVKALYLSQLSDADKTNFESMWSGLDDQERSSLAQLCRDAFNGGMNDIGASATTATGTP